MKFERFTTADGLPSNIIYSIFQDSKGFLWLGTHEGLCRYDGYRFKIFRNDPSDTSTICANQIFSICEDSDGNIWAATANGLCRFNYSQNNFTTVNSENLRRSELVTRVIPANKGELLVLMPQADEFRIKLLNVGSFAVSSVPHESRDFFGFGIMESEDAAIRSHDGQIYLAGHLTSGNSVVRLICRFDPIRKVFTDAHQLPPAKRSEGDYINAFLVDTDNSTWTATTNGHLFYTKDSTVTLTLTDFAPPVPGPSYTMFKVEANNLLIGTRNGLVIYNTLSRSTNLSSYQSLVKSIGQTQVTSMIRDITGNLWIGTFNGLYKLIPFAAFNRMTSEPSSKPQLPLTQVFGIRHAGQGKVWIGYLFGKEKFSLLDPGKRTCETFYTEDHKDHHLVFLSRNPGMDVDLDSLDYWLERYKLAEDVKTFVASEWYESALPSIIETCFKRKFPSARIAHIDAFDWNGEEYWLATKGQGLMRIDKKTSKVTTFLANSPKPTINSNSLTSLLLDQSGNLWIGTNGGGLNYFDRRHNNFRYYTTHEGLANDAVYSLVEDDRGRLWIGTGNGLSCFDPATGRFRNFYRSDGLTNSEFNRFSACKLDKGYILMGGMDGIDYFHPDSVLVSERKPVVQIAELRVLDKDIPVSDWLNLAHNQNYITISFAAMDFRNPAANRFAYKLEGIDEDWVPAAQNSVSYARLSPGKYHFRVRATGPDGIWSEAPAEIHFTIRNPWWKTGWFLGSVVFCALGLLYGIYLFRVTQLKRVIAVRTKISRDLHDEVGATLSGILMYSHLVQQQVKENQVSKADHSLEVIRQSANEMVSRLSDIVWLVNPAHDSFGKLLCKLEEYAIDLTRANGMQLHSELAPETQSLRLPMRARRNIYLVCKEAINNSAKYSRATLLELRAVLTGRVVECIVRDDGKGFDPENYRQGNGLTNMQQRMQEIGAELRLRSKPGEGTEWKIIYRVR
ncbi:MAG TPA: two-component regulator propeller domain-containing protein [Chryseosolibacter sp.]|nr:two-component regulator propeller domain-containing protein [Chryseosolibacter sp.]